jgi:hypothetical protein
MATTQDLLRQRFSEACKDRDALLARAAPLRQRRDALLVKAVADLAVKVDPLDAQIAAVENGLPDLHNEIASIALALGGQTSGC